MVLFFLIMAFAIGLAVPLQSAVNNALRASLHSGSVLAALVSFAVGTAGAAGGLPPSRASPSRRWAACRGCPGGSGSAGSWGPSSCSGRPCWPPASAWPPWCPSSWRGRCCSSLAFDRFGWLGLPVRGLSWVRLAGTALILAGAVLVNFGDRWLGAWQKS